MIESTLADVTSCLIDIAETCRVTIEDEDSSQFIARTSHIMINHISIAVQEPKKVADVLAEIWNGAVYPFPPAPGSFFVVANDGKGTAVEITPAGTVIVPGEGLPDESD